MVEIMLGVRAYAEANDCSERQVQRYLAAGAIPGAVKIRGVWQIPAGAPRPALTDLVPTSSTPPPVGWEIPPGVVESRLGTLYTLEAAALELGTTVGGVRRMGRRGRLDVGPYGPNAALRVYEPRTGALRCPCCHQGATE